MIDFKFRSLACVSISDGLSGIESLWKRHKLAFFAFETKDGMYHIAEYDTENPTHVIKARYVDYVCQHPISTIGERIKSISKQLGNAYLVEEYDGIQVRLYQIHYWS